MTVGDREPRRTGMEPVADTEQGQSGVLFQAEATYRRTRFSDPMSNGHRREILLDSDGLIVHLNFGNNQSPEGVKLDEKIQSLRDKGKRVVVTISEAPEPKAQPSLYEQYVLDVDRR